MISPKELSIPDYVKNDVMDLNGMCYEETDSLEGALPELDVLYMTRIQRERFDDRETYERLKDCYILTTEKMNDAKSDMCILHPLPRVNEISVAIDSDPRACYFKQVLNGKLIRMALILKLLAEKDKEEVKDEIQDAEDNVTDKVEDSKEEVKDEIGNVGDNLGDQVADSEDAILGGQEGINNAINGVGNTAQDTLNQATNAAKEAADDTLVIVATVLAGVAALASVGAVVSAVII
mgnify:CR=1 FL=1